MERSKTRDAGCWLLDTRCLIVALTLALIAGCAGSQKATLQPAKKTEPILLGWTTRSAIQSPQYPWFDSVYAAYQPQSEILHDNLALLSDVEMLVIFGTWCSDSRREVPRFYKIMDDLKLSPDKIQLCGVDRKKGTTDSLRHAFNIERVPTFIVRNHGEEIGRIIESPKITLEIDLFEILMKIPR